MNYVIGKKNNDIYILVMIVTYTTTIKLRIKYLLPKLFLKIFFDKDKIIYKIYFNYSSIAC